MPSSGRLHTTVVVSTTAALIVLVDQATKAWVRDALAPSEMWPASGWVARVFTFSHVRNTGIAFGMFQGRNEVMLLVALAVVAGVLWWRRGQADAGLWLDVPVGMVVAGAVGNAIDRVMRGHVTDFLDFKVWPVFNVADACIFTGVALLTARLWRDERRRAALAAAAVGGSAPAPDGDA